MALHCSTEAAPLGTQLLTESWIARMGRCEFFHTTGTTRRGRRSTRHTTRAGRTGSPCRPTTRSPEAPSTSGSCRAEQRVRVNSERLRTHLYGFFFLDKNARNSLLNCHVCFQNCLSQQNIHCGPEQKKKRFQFARK